MSGFGAFIASSGLRWNRRCAFHPRTRSAIRCRACQSLSFHQSSRMSAAGIVAYPQCRSLVGDFVQCTHISASSGSSSIPSGGHIASFTSSPSFDMRGINVRSPILHCFPLSFSHSYARIMQLWPKILTLTGGLTVKRFIKTVILLLASPFVVLMLGIVLAIVRCGDFLTDDD